MSKMDKLCQFTQDYCQDRLTELDKKFSKLKSVKEAFQVMEGLFEELLKDLPEEKKKIAYKFQESTIRLSVLHEDNYYMYGLADGLMIRDCMKDCKKGKK